MTRIAIINGRVIDPLSGQDEHSNVYLADGRIVAIASKLPDYEPDFSIDARNKIVSPGLIDVNANLLPSDGSIETVADCLQQAVKAGITRVGMHTFNANYCLRADEIRYLLERSKANRNSAKPYLIGPLTENLQGDRLAELMLLKEAGCIGFSNGFNSFSNTLVKYRCYDYAAMLGLKIFISPQDPFLAMKGGMHEGQVSARLGLPGIPALAETLALAQEFQLVRETQLEAHFLHLSSSRSIPILRQALSENLRISCDTSISHLYLSDLDVHLDNGLSHVNPPLRSSEDKQQLRQALRQGYIGSIASNHTAIPKQYKEVPFQDSQPGIAAWPIVLPLALRFGEEEGLSLQEVLATLIQRPAASLGITAGSLAVGKTADIIIFDPEEEWFLSEQELDNFGSNNPFRNWQLKGRVKYTLVDGHLVYED